jgi:hypothetical protein
MYARYVSPNNVMIEIVDLLIQWIPTCGTCTPSGTWWTGWGYAKIILIMAENAKKKKGLNIETQKRSYEILVYKERLM